MEEEEGERVREKLKADRQSELEGRVMAGEKGCSEMNVVREGFAVRGACSVERMSGA